MMMVLLRAFVLGWVLPALLVACASAPVRLHESSGEAAVIILPEQLEVVTVNGLEVAGAGGLLRKGDTMLEVAAGRYEVLAFYRELWERGDQHDMLRSDPALFVVDAAAGQRYRIDYARPANLDEARALAAAFTGWVENVATGERLESAASGLRFRRGLVAAATFDDTLVEVAPGGRSTQRVAPLPQEEAVPEAQLPGATERDWLTLMKSWWSEASVAERREFLRWVGERR